MMGSQGGKHAPPEKKEKQEGKDMAKTREAFIDAMKQQTIGCEIEMAGITRQHAAQIVAEYFGTQDTVRHTGGCYDTWTARDRSGREWKAVNDSSIHATRGGCAELVTPILTYGDIEDLQEIVRRMRRAGAISNPDHGCGVHIHIGAAGHTAKTLRNLVNIMAAHEELLWHAVLIDSSRVRRWCKPVDPRFLREVNDKKPETMEQLADIWYQSQNETGGRFTHYNGSRYHQLNLHATFTKGTIEFRLFQFDNPHGKFKGGLHAGRLKAFIQLALALSQAAKEAKSASPKKQETDNPKYAMRCWLLRLGFIGEEFATAREHLTEKLPGDAAFRHGRPQAAQQAAA